MAVKAELQEYSRKCLYWLRDKSEFVELIAYWSEDSFVTGLIRVVIKIDKGLITRIRSIHPIIWLTISKKLKNPKYDSEKHFHALKSYILMILDHVKAEIMTLLMLSIPGVINGSVEPLIL
jgi:hypothetical protein